VAAHITLSTGGVTCTPGKNTDLRSFVKQADDMLYAAKGAGRNQLIWYKANADPECESKS